MADEAAVVAAAAGGDRSAFGQLMEHYQRACYGLAWRLLGDPDLAADATQDAFIHAYDHIAAYRGGVFRSWLLKITANAAYDILRRAQRRPTTGLPEPDEGEADEVAEAIRSPVGTVKSRIHRGRLRLRVLLADQRELFEG